MASRLKVNQQSVRNWIDQGALPHVRVGTRRVRIPSDALDSFIGRPGFAAGREPPGAEPPVKPKRPTQDLKAVASVIDRMLILAAKLPFESDVGRELAESAGRLQVLLLKAKNTTAPTSSE